MATKTVNTRIQLKSDTEANWNKAGPKDGSRGFVPLLGELIIYSADGAHPFSRLKVGDGEHDVTALPFVDAGTISGASLNEIILAYETSNDFPAIGQNNKLYVNLFNKSIYYYSNGKF
jgi:hypothetical protein